MSYDIVAIVVYFFALVLPVMVGLTLMFARMLSGGKENYIQRRLSQRLPLLVLAGIATVALDVFVTANPKVRKMLMPLPFGLEVARLLQFPLGMFLALVFQPVIDAFKPRHIDPRFEQTSRGASPMWILLGFLIMSGLMVYGPEDQRSLSTPGRMRALFMTKDRTGDSPLIPKANLVPLEDAFTRLRHKITDLAVRGGKAVTDSSPAQRFNVTNYERYSKMVRERAEEAGLPPDLVVGLVAIESGFDPDFRGAGGGVGLMNVTSGMARQVGVVDFLDPAGNLDVGIQVLKAQADLFGIANQRQWLAAYHFGTKHIQDSPGSVNGNTTESAFVDQVLVLAE